MKWKKELERTLNGHGLKIVFISGEGRCGLITTRDFSPGELIFSQEPYAAVPNCYESLSSEKDDSKLHEIESRDTSRFLVGQKIPPSFCLVMKVLLKVKLQQNKEIPSLGIDNYKLVAALKSSITELEDDTLAKFVHRAKVIKFLMPSLDFDLSEMIQYISKVSHNARAIYEPNLGQVGFGLYPVISLIKKSCMANSIVKFDGPIAYVRAIEYIPANCEVLIRSNDPDASCMERQTSLSLKIWYDQEAMLEGYRGSDEERNSMDEIEDAEI